MDDKSDLIFGNGMAERSSLIGERVDVRAVLVLRGSECFLIRDKSSVDDGVRIEIYHPGLEDELDLRVGGWVGGPASYLDHVEISGRLERGTARRSPLSICEIDRLSLERAGEEFVVIDI